MSLGISIQSLSKAFLGKRVLNDISLSIPQNKITMIIGPSPSGKTLLIKCILGLIKMDFGEILIGDRPAKDVINESGKVGVMFQQNALFDSMPIWQNVAFKIAKSTNRPINTYKDFAVAKLETVGLESNFATLYPSQLSGGMQKRAAMARAMADNPELLILDEPTAGLDPVLTTVILDIIDRYISTSAATVLAVTGDMKTACNRSDQLILLHNGTVHWSGASRQAKQDKNPYLQQMLQAKISGPIPIQPR